MIVGFCLVSNVHTYLKNVTVPSETPDISWFKSKKEDVTTSHFAPLKVIFLLRFGVCFLVTDDLRDLLHQQFIHPWVWWYFFCLFSSVSLGNVFGKFFILLYRFSLNVRPSEFKSQIKMLVWYEATTTPTLYSHIGRYGEPEVWGEQPLRRPVRARRVFFFFTVRNGLFVVGVRTAQRRNDVPPPSCKKT